MSEQEVLSDGVRRKYEICNLRKASLPTPAVASLQRLLPLTCGMHVWLLQVRNSLEELRLQMEKHQQLRDQTQGGGLKGLTLGCGSQGGGLLVELRGAARAGRREWHQTCEDWLG